ncbi:MAG: hypothetical protein TREMPRED_002560, partial [Tremellales sp. Tagirdzhanova-0007]
LAAVGSIEGQRGRGSDGNDEGGWESTREAAVKWLPIETYVVNKGTPVTMADPQRRRTTGETREGSVGKEGQAEGRYPGNRSPWGLIIIIPDGYVTPSFPSLYIPTLSSSRELSGIYLYEAEAIWRFTFYWTLLMLCGIFLICSLFAAFTILLSLTVHRTSSQPIPTPSSQFTDNPIRPDSLGHKRPMQPRLKRKRPPLWPVLLLPLLMTSVAAVIALVTGTVVGFALAAVYAAGGFSLSTWVPFLWALIQVIVLIISSYSTLTSIL